MTKRRDDLFDSPGADEPRTGSLGLKLVLFGALLPVFLGALLVGGFLLARSPGEGARTVAAAEAPLDCSLARDAWRPPCLKAGADGPATTGSVEPKIVTGRSSSVRTAAAEPAEALTEPAKPAVPAANPSADPSTKPPVPPARPAAREAEKARDVAAATDAPKPTAPPAPSSRTAAAPPEEPVPAAKPPRVAVPEPAAKALVPPPEPAPAIDEKTVAASPVAPAAKPDDGVKAAAASPPRAAPERKRDVDRTASVPPASPRVRAVEDDDDEPVRPARLSRHRAKAKEAARTVAAVRARATKRERIRTARERTRVREPAPVLDGGYGGLRVTSQQIQTLPDGRQIVVQTRPRAEDVRALVAQHHARFGQRRVASPIWGAPAYGGWYAGAADW